ncbi:MAG: hypothetical protein JRN45_03035 [Nitrososphaerota archaeon]|nr:hypothetical protein [Nitrososphaerota archaeon]
MEYDVQVTVGDLTATTKLAQDEIDIIRQEYIDLGAARTPAYDEFGAPVNEAFHSGNYGYIMDGGMQSKLDDITQQASALGVNFHVSCGCRNPRNNVCVSHYPTTSHHVWGKALDLKPDPVSPDNLDLLRQAGLNAGLPVSICEAQGGAHGVPCDTPGVNHVHVQW